MSRVKVAISVDENTLRRVDELVARSAYPSRIRVIQMAIAEKLTRTARSRLAVECAKLDAKSEQVLADEGMRYDGRADQTPIPGSPAREKGALRSARFGAGEQRVAGAKSGSERERAAIGSGVSAGRRSFIEA